MNKKLKCERCGKVQEPCSEMEYSQGDLVCLKCKEESKESDKRAFDRDWYSDRT
jgi:hypothetical protein